MDKKSKILLVVVFVIGLISFGFTFYKTVVKQDFEIVNTDPPADAGFQGE